GDIDRGGRFIARRRHRKPYAGHSGGDRGSVISRPMGRRTETSMAPSSRRQRLAALVADRVAHTAGSLARSSMASSALIGTNNFLPILMTGSSPRLAAS